MQKNNPFTLENFLLIFEYGTENSGQTMWHRFVHDFSRNEATFLAHLCEIDRAKFDKWVENNPNYLPSARTMHICKRSYKRFSAKLNALLASHAGKFIKTQTHHK